MSKDKEVPYISKELCEWLEGIFRQLPPDENESYGQLMVRAGVAKVIQKLRYEHNQQQD